MYKKAELPTRHLSLSFAQSFKKIPKETKNHSLAGKDGVELDWQGLVANGKVKNRRIGVVGAKAERLKSTINPSFGQ
jgi:hypothetical protein